MPARRSRSTTRWIAPAASISCASRSIGTDPTPYKIEQDPGNPAADAQGFVKMPNVDLLIELADMREANRTYEANLQVAKQSADMMNQTVSLLKDA